MIGNSSINAQRASILPTVNDETSVSEAFRSFPNSNIKSPVFEDEFGDLGLNVEISDFFLDTNFDDPELDVFDHEAVRNVFEEIGVEYGADLKQDSALLDTIKSLLYL